MTGHTVTLQHDGPRRRWACTCGWATDWTTYTDPRAGPDAVRHQTDHHKKG